MRFPLLLAIASFGALGLCACNDDDDDDDDRLITPTPVPLVTPTPTPIPGATPIDTDVTDGIDEPTDPDTDGSTGGGGGASMSSAEEQVAILSLDSTAVDQTLLTVARVNGETWEFQIPGIPTTRIGTAVIYRNPGLVFGSTAGEIAFADGTTTTIVSAVRIE